MAKRTAIPQVLAEALASLPPATPLVSAHGETWRQVREFCGLPALGEPQAKRLLPSSPAFAFWKLRSNERLEEFLFDGLLAAVQQSPKPISLKKLPKGYGPLLFLLQFESEFQYEGWDAVTDRTPADMEALARALTFFGARTEAKALRAVARAASAGSNDAASLEDIYAKTKGTRQHRIDMWEQNMSLVFAAIRAHPEYFEDAQV